MISTLYLFQFLAFFIWQLSAVQTAGSATGYFSIISGNKRTSRGLAGVLMIVTCILFTAKLGLMSGICSFMIGLMGVGCLSVTLTPFNYLSVSSVAVVYILACALELFI